jgi:hypothetical protein
MPWRKNIYEIVLCISTIFSIDIIDIAILSILRPQPQQWGQPNLFVHRFDPKCWARSKGNIYRKQPCLTGKNILSCRFFSSFPLDILKPIHVDLDAHHIFMVTPRFARSNPWNCSFCENYVSILSWCCHSVHVIPTVRIFCCFRQAATLLACVRLPARPQEVDKNSNCGEPMVMYHNNKHLWYTMICQTSLKKTKYIHNGL